MDCWYAGDDGIFVRLEPDSRCDEDGTVYLLLDGFGDIAQEYLDHAERRDGVEIRVRHEIEDSNFVRVTEEVFPSGRTNYDREVEFDELETLDESELPDEDELRRKHESWKRRHRRESS